MPLKSYRFYKLNIPLLFFALGAFLLTSRPTTNAQLFSLNSTTRGIILAMHNLFRAQYGVKKELVWDTDLESKSQTAAIVTLQNMGCNLKNFRHQGLFPGIGENLAAMKGFSFSFQTLGLGVKGWVDEISGQSIAQVERQSVTPTEETGHATQMISARSSSVGCAMSLQASCDIYVIACEYFPPGNLVGSPYNVDDLAKNTITTTAAQQQITIASQIKQPLLTQVPLPISTSTVFTAVSLPAVSSIPAISTISITKTVLQTPQVVPTIPNFSNNIWQQNQVISEPSPVLTFIPSQFTIKTTSTQGNFAQSSPQKGPNATPSNALSLTQVLPPRTTPYAYLTESQQQDTVQTQQAPYQIPQYEAFSLLAHTMSIKDKNCTRSTRRLRG